ncbi:MAG: CpsD/CapB family tyrosine-protein kinase [Desulfobacterales bacterium]|nr:CpsD/CapB family tyrosine-protein kinase [Desulfobacterales bacterium]
MEDAKPSERGLIYTFYSYKGGVGRSMALANVAALLAKWSLKVLVVDWDLEAPGIERFFNNSSHSLSKARKSTPGLVDLIYSYIKKEGVDWRDFLLKAHPFDSGRPVNILSAGRDAPDYVRSVQGLDWSELFEERKLGFFLEKLRDEWAAEFDVVLIDSRTGITDIGGICTIHMPDILVLFFTTNRQSLDGVIDVIKRARAAQSRLPFNRNFLIGVPVPARDESQIEYKAAREWRKIFAYELSDLYRDWLPENKTPSDTLELLSLPHVPYWSFGERLSVVEESITDPKNLSFSYAALARLIAARLQWPDR